MKVESAAFEHKRIPNLSYAAMESNKWYVGETTFKSDPERRLLLKTTNGIIAFSEYGISGTDRLNTSDPDYTALYLVPSGETITFTV